MVRFRRYYMSDVVGWICDICGKTFKENTFGYKNKSKLDINIYLGLFENNEKFKYKDTCLLCRRNIVGSIERKINELQKENEYE
jgi:hypothetical protein